MKKYFSLILITICISMFTSCGTKKSDESALQSSKDLNQIIKSDTLRVATMYGSTSYFLFRDELLGFDYEMAENIANFLHLNL